MTDKERDALVAYGRGFIEAAAAFGANLLQLGIDFERAMKPGPPPEPQPEPPPEPIPEPEPSPRPGPRLDPAKLPEWLQANVTVRAVGEVVDLSWSDPASWEAQGVFAKLAPATASQGATYDDLPDPRWQPYPAANWPASN